MLQSGVSSVLLALTVSVNGAFAVEASPPGPSSPGNLPPDSAIARLHDSRLSGIAQGRVPAALPIPPLCAARIEQEIRIDGKLDEPAWQRACRVEQWFETQPGDNTPPGARSLGYLAYDGRYVYVGLDLEDPEPRLIRAPLADHDGVTPYMDHVGILLDAQNDGKTGVIFAVSAQGVQYDSVMDDTQGTDDTSPDFYWDAAASIDARGWTAEMRIPFSNLRYTNRNPEAWRIVLYRIYPRAFWHVFQSTTIPRGLSCWVCRASPLRGLKDLPRGGGVVAAPYLSARRVAQPRADLGSPLASGVTAGEAGADLKWRPSPGHALDATLNPDFSQIEADATQIGANERFALLYPEKRAFFLEGSNLLATPIQAIYTRTITAPRWGIKATGRTGTTSFVALVTRDNGGGSVILPGPTSSTTANQDFESYAAVGRVKRDLGNSFVSLLVSDREVDGGGSNRVLGPDFEWRPNLRDRVVGQFLVSRSLTPRRPDLTDRWDGRRLSGYAGVLRWFHTTQHLDWTGAVRGMGDGFRADNGFVPQVGSLRTYGEAGWTFRPEGLLRQVRPFLIVDRFVDWHGGLVSRQTLAGLLVRGRWNLSARSQLSFDRIRTGPAVVPRTQFLYDVVVSPSQKVPTLELTGATGQAIDFENHRNGTGYDVGLSATMRPSIHLELQLKAGRRVLYAAAAGPDARVLSAQIERLRATYSLSRRSFLRVVVEYAETTRDPALYGSAVDRRSADFSGSAVFAYKLNWQTVFFVGYGDERGLAADARLVPAGRQLFVKLSYALQR